MPEEGLAYVLGLEDQLSGPAKAEQSALRALTGQIDATEKSLRALRREQLLNRELGIKDKSAGIRASRMGLDLADMRAELKTLKPPPELEETKGLLGTIGEHLIKGAGGSALMAGGLAAVGFAAAEAIEKVAELGVESVKFAVEAAEFKHNTEIAYTAVKGTAAAGKETFEQIDKMATAVHMPAEQAHKLASDLMLQGLEDTKAIGKVIAADSALIRTGQLQGAEKLKIIVERSLASGHFDPGKLGGGKGGAEASGRALAGLGVHLPDLISDIAKRTGQSIGEVKLALKQGKIDTQVGIEALTEAIDKSPIGTAARGKYDFGDFFTDLQNKWRGIVQDIDLGPIEQGLTDLKAGVNALDGEGIKGFFQGVVDGLGEAITDATILGLTLEDAFLEAEVTLKPLIDLIDGGIDALGKLGAVGAGAEGGGAAIEGLDLSYRPEASGLGGVLTPQRQGDYAPPEAEPNAEGGRVMEPAPGEVFASVAPGEFIMPEGGMGVGNDNGARHIHVDVGGIHVSGSGQSAHELAALLESQIADLFERAALELGR